MPAAGESQSQARSAQPLPTMTTRFAFSFHGAPRAGNPPRYASPPRPSCRTSCRDRRRQRIMPPRVPAGPGACRRRRCCWPADWRRHHAHALQPLHARVVALGAPCEVHAPTCPLRRNWPRWPRKFYAPDDWAEQLDEYVRQNIARPVVVCTVGRAAPVALEMWRLRRGEKGGLDTTIAGVSFISPPLWQGPAGAGQEPPAPARSGCSRSRASAASSTATCAEGRRAHPQLRAQPLLRSGGG